MSYRVVQDTKHMAIGCLYLLTRRAIPDFPGTTRASPSLWVYVHQAAGPGLRPGDEKFFPFRVSWKVWQYVIIPVLTVTNPGTDPSLIGSGATPDPLTGKCYDLGIEIQTTLRRSLRMEGNVARVDLREYDNLIALLSQALGLLMVEQGMLPAGRVNPT